MFQNLWIALIGLPIILGEMSMIGFDCHEKNPGSIINITKLSLIDIDECHIDQDSVQINNKTIQLLETKTFYDIPIIQCKVKIDRTMLRCSSYFNFAKPVDKSRQNYILELSYESCKRLHEERYFIFNNKKIIDNIKPNSTTSQGVNLAGNALEGSCHTGTYADQYGSWDDVLVTGVVEITIQNYNAKVDLKNDKLKLRSGTICKFSDLHCLDIEGGNSFWNPLQSLGCLADKFSIVYYGKANEIIHTKENQVRKYYNVKTENNVFSLLKKDEISDCDGTLLTTEYPKLFIRILSNQFDANNVVNYRPQMSDILYEYSNKVVSLERHEKKQLEDSYIDILYKECEMENKIFRQTLSLAYLHPDHFAYNLMKKRGYMARVSGEVIYIVKCTPMEVIVDQNQTDCFEQLPVIKNDELWFLKPVTHILMKIGTKIKCNAATPGNYKIQGQWKKIMPGIQNTNSPGIIHHEIQKTWKYEDPGNLATASLYNNEELQGVMDDIMFPMIGQVLLNTVAKAMYREPEAQEETFNNIMSAEGLKKLGEKTIDHIWQKLITFGNLSAAGIMIYIIFHMILTVSEMLLRGHSLYIIFGFSIKLLAAVFNALTQYLINLHHHRKFEKQHENAQENMELQTVVATTQNPIMSNLHTKDTTQNPIMSNLHTKDTTQKSITSILPLKDNLKNSNSTNIPTNFTQYPKDNSEYIQIPILEYNRLKKRSRQYKLDRKNETASTVSFDFDT